MMGLVTLDLCNRSNIFRLNMNSRANFSIKAFGLNNDFNYLIT